MARGVTPAGSAEALRPEAGARRKVPARADAHNLSGQRMGRKGRDTRERILTVTRELLAEGTDVSMSAVARRASLGMASLYLYFADLTALLLAVLEPVMVEAEDAFIQPLRTRWPDDALEAHCFAFVTALHGFWHRNTTILHLRNSMVDQGDRRMATNRVDSARPVIALLIGQMDHDAAAPTAAAKGMATVLYTGIERVVTVATDRALPRTLPGTFAPDVVGFLQAEGRLLALAIRDLRATAPNAA